MRARVACSRKGEDGLFSKPPVVQYATTRGPYRFTFEVDIQSFELPGFSAAAKAELGMASVLLAVLRTLSTHAILIRLFWCLSKPVACPTPSYARKVKET